MSNLILCCYVMNFYNEHDSFPSEYYPRSTLRESAGLKTLRQSSLPDLSSKLARSMHLVDCHIESSNHAFQYLMIHRLIPRNPCPSRHYDPSILPSSLRMPQSSCTSFDARHYPTLPLSQRPSSFPLYTPIVPLSNQYWHAATHHRAIPPFSRKLRCVFRRILCVTAGWRWGGTLSDTASQALM